MKKIWLNIRIFFHYLAHGMKAADDLLTTSEKTNADGSGIEQQNEKQSVYADLLKGEVTQEVKELRHEMYYAERESYKYEYDGGGRVKKRNNLFEYTGKIYNKQGLDVLIVQENKETPSTLMEQGIYCMGEKVDLSEKAKGDLGVKDRRDFTISINRDFIPSFRIEAYATKLVIRSDGKKLYLDLYTPLYTKQFDNKSKLFVKAMEKIYDGDMRSDIIDFNGLEFISKCAYGSDDLILYRFKEVHFLTINKFDGSYVLTFTAEANTEKEDLISEFYDEATAKKCENHEARNTNGVTVDLETAMVENNENNYDIETAESLLNELNNN